MRRMARLVQLVKGLETVTALLDVSNFYIMQEAIVEMCLEGRKSKPGLKVALGSLIKGKAKDKCPKQNWLQNELALV